MVTKPEDPNHHHGNKTRNHWTTEHHHGNKIWGPLTITMATKSEDHSPSPWRQNVKTTDHHLSNKTRGPLTVTMATKPEDHSPSPWLQNLRTTHHHHGDKTRGQCYSTFDAPPFTLVASGNGMRYGDWLNNASQRSSLFTLPLKRFQPQSHRKELVLWLTQCYNIHQNKLWQH